MRFPRIFVVQIRKLVNSTKIMLLSNLCMRLPISLDAAAWKLGSHAIHSHNFIVRVMATEKNLVIALFVSHDI